MTGGDFAIVNFTDARGHRWRKRSDTYELQPSGPRKINWAQKSFQGATKRIRLFRWLAATVPQNRTRRAIQKHPERIPLAMRWCRATHGYWGAGEMDPWLCPEGAPPWWRYEGLPNPSTGKPPERSPL